MELKLAAAGKGSAKNITVSDETFGGKFNQALVHQVLTAQMAATRAGTKAQKTRAEVRGGGAKPWRQKGTGQARAGTIRSPLWRKGGIIFAAKPRSYAQKVNRKMYQAAMRSVLSELVKQERLVVVENLAMTSPKTRDLVAKLKELNIQDVLVITDNIEKNLDLAARNLPHVTITDIKNINLADLIGFNKVLITVAAVKQFEELLG